MTVFITRYYKKLNACLMALLLLVAATVHAEGINVERAELQVADETYQVNADFAITFSREVEEAINKGVTLNFLVEFVLMEPNKYWLDQEIASASLSMRLSYHALSRQYLLTTGTRQSTYATLQEALEELGKVRNWTVMEKTAIKKEAPYYAMLRMRLDQNKLPKPLQVSVIGSENWNLVSERHRWIPVLEKPEASK
ncbi:MAG TPA: DUF4390 domain-containing protein [Methylophilaceae bacterium]|jgi:hypothetical protein